MAIKQKEIEINGDKYIISTIPGTDGVKLGARIAKFAGVVMEGAAVHGNMASAIAVALVSTDDDEIVDLVKQLAKKVTKNNIQVNFDNDFQGEYDVLLDIVKESLLLNFGSVFTKLGFNVQAMLTPGN